MITTQTTKTGSKLSKNLFVQLLYTRVTESQSNFKPWLVLWKNFLQTTITKKKRLATQTEREIWMPVEKKRTAQEVNNDPYSMLHKNMIDTFVNMTTFRRWYFFVAWLYLEALPVAHNSLTSRKNSLNCKPYLQVLWSWNDWEIWLTVLERRYASVG